jgi:hypothetical protein
MAGAGVKVLEFLLLAVKKMTVPIQIFYADFEHLSAVKGSTNLVDIKLDCIAVDCKLFLKMLASSELRA